MTRPARVDWTRLLPGALWALGAVFLVWWAAHNPSADGFQNEYLHHGNALDLYAALTEPDLHTLRWIAYTGYWPWGFLAVPWPMMALLGPGRLALLLGNLLHLAALLWGAGRLGRRLALDQAHLVNIAIGGEPCAVIVWVGDRCRERNALQVWRERLQPRERKAQQIAALAIGKGVHFIDDDALEGGKHVHAVFVA